MHEQPVPHVATRPFEVTNRLVLSIAVPMTLAYLTTPLLGLTDTAVVGQFGDAAMLGGLAAGAIVFDVVFTTFNFLRSGTTGLVAQAFGRGREREEQAVFWRAFGIAVLSGLLLILLAPVIASAGASFIGSEPRVTDSLHAYVAIRLLAAPFSLTNYVVLGYVLGRGEGAVGLLLQLLLNGCNIFLSIWLGLVLGWGVEGVAWGTVAGETIAAAVGLAVVLRRFAAMPRLPLREVFELPPVLLMLSVNRDIMIRSFVLLAAFALLVRAGAQLGTLTLAANGVLMNFFLAAAFFLDGFSTAAKQIAGRAIGARHAPAFYQGVRLSSIWGFGVAIVISLLLLAFGGDLIAVITTSPEVRVTAEVYLPWAALTAVTGVLAFQMDGVFIGATWSRDMRNMMLFSFIFYLGALLLFGRLWGNHGLWAALHVFLIARGISLAAIMPLRARQAFA